MSPSELRVLAERAKETDATLICHALADALLELLAENERLRKENAYLRTNGTEFAP